MSTCVSLLNLEFMNFYNFILINNLLRMYYIHKKDFNTIFLDKPLHTYMFY